MDTFTSDHVLKFGSGVVSTPEGEIRSDDMDEITRQIAHLYNADVWPVIVTSGAINVGRKILDVINRGTSEPLQQALSTIGHPALHAEYSTRLAGPDYGIPSAQLLVTTHDLKREEETNNLLATLTELKKHRVVPIINENDATATEEFATDNDFIAMNLAKIIRAERLTIVTENVRGLENKYHLIEPYVKPDDQEKFAKLVREDRGKFNRGGMQSKYAVACEAANSGIHALIMGKADLPELAQRGYMRQFGTEFEATAK